MTVTEGRRSGRGPHRSLSPTKGPIGFRWMYRRGYGLAAPAEYAFGWLATHAPPVAPLASGTRLGSESVTEARIERQSYPGRGIEKVTRWELLPPDLVVFHDQVFERGRLVVEGEERNRFLGGPSSGCVAEVMAYRKPVGWVSRLGESAGIRPLSRAIGSDPEARGGTSG